MSSDKVVSPLLVIVGPTASGKTDFAMDIAEKYNGEIICADSRTVYKGMNIGTAKPTLQQQNRVPHHMLDIIEPSEHFTAAQYKRMACRHIEEIAQRGKLPILVGGSGLYIDAIIFDYNFGPPADVDRRSTLEKFSLEELQRVCREEDIDLPENKHNRRHLIRAIELGGVIKQNRRLRPHTLVVGLQSDNQELKRRIERRAAIMLEAGIVGEVKFLSERYGWESEAMKANIYRAFRGVVQGAKTEQEALEEVIRSDISLAKRQMTWFKRNPYIVWGAPVGLIPKIDDFIRTSISL
jgi:tRNA dimethylallyltransferase